MFSRELFNGKLPLFSKRMEFSLNSDAFTQLYLDTKLRQLINSIPFMPLTRWAPQSHLRLVHTHTNQHLRALVDDRETPRVSTDNREFKMYDATVAKTSLKIASLKFVYLFRHYVSLLNF